MSTACSFGTKTKQPENCLDSEIEGVSSALSHLSRFFVTKCAVQEPRGKVLSQQAGGRGTHAREQLYLSRGNIFFLTTNSSVGTGMLCSHFH